MNNYSTILKIKEIKEHDDCVLKLSLIQMNNTIYLLSLSKTGKVVLSNSNNWENQYLQSPLNQTLSMDSSLKNDIYIGDIFNSIIKMKISIKNSEVKIIKKNNYNSNNYSIRDVYYDNKTKFLIAGSENGSIELFKGKKILITFFFDNSWNGINSMTLFNDTNILAASYNSIKLFDILKKKEIYKLNKHETYISQIILNKSNQNNLISGSWDNTVKFWDLRQKIEIKCLKNFGYRVTSLAINEEGNFLIAGTADGWVSCWDLRFDYLFEAFRPHLESVENLCFIKNQLFSTASRDTSVKIFSF